MNANLKKDDGFGDLPWAMLARLVEEGRKFESKTGRFRFRDELVRQGIDVEYLCLENARDERIVVFLAHHRICSLWVAGYAISRFSELYPREGYELIDSGIN